jgi:MFS family permease
MLLDAGIYGSECSQSKPGCHAQLLKLNWMFSVASTLTNVASLPIGIFLDYLGSRWTILTGTFLFSCGTMLFGLSSAEWPMYTIAYGLIGVGGPFIYIGCLNLSLAFPKKSGLIMAGLTGCFDASSLIFFLFQV